MKKINFKLSVLCSHLAMLAFLLTFCSCDKFNKITIPISSATIEIDGVNVVKSTAKDDELNFFSAEKNLTLDDILGLSEDALKYKNKIEDISVGEQTSIKITATDGQGTVVKEFILSANTFPNGINVPQYDLGTEYYGTNIANFASQLLFDILTKSSVTVSTSGKTDLISGENLSIKIVLQDISLLAHIF